MHPFTLPFKDDAKVIELGGGETPLFHPNVDVLEVPTVDIVANLEDPLPIESESYDGVFSKFVLEHLRVGKVRGFIAEVHRILKPGGIAIIITANLLEQAKVLLERAEWDDHVLYMIFGGNPDFPSNYHHSSPSPQYAERLFKEAGFFEVDIAEWPPSKEIWGRATEMIIGAKKSKAMIKRSL